MARTKKTEVPDKADGVAEEKHDADQPVSSDLVRMMKCADTLDVHPTCVAAHKAAGWVEG